MTLRRLIPQYTNYTSLLLKALNIGAILFIGPEAPATAGAAKIANGPQRNILSLTLGSAVGQ